ncbi:Gfo/Idh/MocA family protein [Microbacterium imperiale]|uniref:Oxidoreductase n=1 Tax=Microbacterium imperiale TaxID=33884 RepID=A0A9W6HHK0_9MICO|nr:Gfo/Idh/MocA family oxidoreductase [Microbacterium imperiale]MBP2419174.1 putative dehydrogenase [Microbacterium imperiale]MDS0198952.1 Gfo/Idh/MocA family oxidoreductase [Microbacterium imperiale]BFE39516.1 Gfo/Idh/MocA family oxidoreductase [Microbacterium imperiale]GLJ80154.1 oxidoreductase [Microbacterium imperiale]
MTDQTSSEHTPAGLRWGILATGGIAHAFTRDLLTAGRRVVAVGSRTEESASRFAAEYGIPHAHGSYEQLAADPEVDIIYVATPHPAHRDAAALAIQHGKHVLVEKPFTLTRDEAVVLRDLAADAGVLVMEAMWTRYLPHMVRLREIVAAGTIGDVRALFADHTQSISDDPTHRLNDLALGGGALLDLGIYPVSFACDVLGIPTQVRALGRLQETGADAEVATVMTHPSGAVSTTVSSSRAAGPNTAHIVGTAGRIDISGVWYSATDFRVTGADGTVIEEYRTEIEGRGMQFQALEAEALVAAGRIDGDILPIAETVAIMGVLDDIRAQIGVRYPQEG